MNRIVETGSRPENYQPFINIAQDSSGEIARARLKTLQGGRFQLTDELTDNLEFNSQAQQISGELPLQTDFQKVVADQIKRKVPALRREVLGEYAGLEVPNLEEIVDIFFDYSSVLAPAYLAFAKELQKFTQEVEADRSRLNVFLFAGRDSFPFLLGFKRFQAADGDASKTVYAPLNRLNYRRFFGSDKYDQEFLGDLSHFYTKNSLSGNNVFVVDFGFIGSLERINQIILNTDTRPDSLYHFLFSTFRKNKPPWFLDSLEKKGFDTSYDSTHVEAHMGGFVNRLLTRYPADKELWAIFMQEAHDFSEWSPFLNPYMLFMQEIGSGINESREDSIHPSSKRGYPGTHLKFASLQQIVGICSFLEGLRFHLDFLNPDDIGDTGVLDSLRKSFEVFERSQSFFNQFIPQEDRRHINGVPVSSAFGEVSVMLEELQTLPISTVNFTRED